MYQNKKDAISHLYYLIPIDNFKCRICPMESKCSEVSTFEDYLVVDFLQRGNRKYS